MAQQNFVELAPGIMVDSSLYPRIDLSETSSRPGVEGLRYVPIPGKDPKLEIGDTNTGLGVYSSLPRTPQLPVADDKKTATDWREGLRAIS